MPNEEVTFVVATYNRPDTLAIALRSVKRQSQGGWEVLVVGDDCSAETAATVLGFGDPRIRYVNISRRFGHQSGPNSVGGLLATTPLLAYLNHDDILLPDHLARARAALRNGADFFVGAALFAESRSEQAINSPAPLFLEISRSDLVAADAFAPGGNLFEPASAWVFDRRLVEKVGIWAHPRRTYRTPLQNFVMRAWRADARFAFGDLPTVLKIVTFRGEAAIGGTYAVASSQHRALEDRLIGKSADEQRSIALGGIKDPMPVARARKRRNVLSRVVDRLLFCSASRALYRVTGVDTVAIYGSLLRRVPGKTYNETVIRRTSRPLPPPEDYEKHVAAAVASARSSMGLPG